MMTETFFHIFEKAADIVPESMRSGEQTRFVVSPRQGFRIEPFSASWIRFLENTRFLLLKSRACFSEEPDTYHYAIDVRK